MIAATDRRPGDGTGRRNRAGTGAEAGERVRAAETDRDQARADAAQVEESAWLAQQQEAARALAAAGALRAGTERVRAGADKTLAQFRAGAAREREEVRTDLRARRAADRAGVGIVPSGVPSG